MAYWLDVSYVGLNLVMCQKGTDVVQPARMSYLQQQNPLAITKRESMDYRRSVRSVLIKQRESIVLVQRLKNKNKPIIKFIIINQRCGNDT